MAHKSSRHAPASSAQRPIAALQDYLDEVVQERGDEALLLRALTHRSYSYENGNVPHNERLEFLGDSVLGLVVTDTLYRAHPDLPEGQLAKLRAAVVNSRALADVGRTIGLGEFILLGRGEETTGGRDKASILADTTEALIGCLYVSAGLDTAARFIHHVLDPLMAESASLGAGLDWKTSLQELAIDSGRSAPEYSVESEGPDHDKFFTAVVRAGQELLGSGTGRSKKEAEQRAAEAAWRMLRAESEAGSKTGPAEAPASPAET